MSDNDDPVTLAQCKEVSGKILNEVSHLQSRLDEMGSDTKKIKESLYGVERAGKVEGGLVNMVSEMKKASEKAWGGTRWFLERIFVPIILAAITAYVLRFVH